MIKLREIGGEEKREDKERDCVSKDARVVLF